MRVIKVGGSLLDLDGLASRISDWLDRQPAMPSVAIAGGGEMADVVRAAFARHALDEEAAHWLCIRILGVTAELLAHLLPGCDFVTQFDDLVRKARCQLAPNRLLVFDCQQFLRRTDACSANPLPHSWDVTSDSIAARLAERLAADELVLLKSSLPDSSWAAVEAAEAGYVDRYFPLAMARLAAVRCVDLRAPEFPDAAFRLPRPRG